MSSSFSSAAEAVALFDALGVPQPQGDLQSRSPIDGQVIGSVRSAGRPTR